MKVALCVTIDTECDKDVQWSIPRPMGFSSVVEAIPRRLMPLCRAHGLPPTLLLSPEVMNDPDSVAVLRSIRDCELGTHLHGEFIAPDERPDAKRTDEVQLQYRPDVEYSKLENLTKLFVERFGALPRSFRAGRFGLSARTFEFLVTLGYRVDSSVTPFWTHRYAGGQSLDFWDAPWQPFRPAAGWPVRRGRLPLVEAPVTIAVPAMLGWPVFARRRLARHEWLRKRLLAGFGEPGRAVWLRPVRSSADQMTRLADDVVAASHASRGILLNMMFHSNELVAGASPYSATPEDVDRLLASLDTVFAHVRRRHGASFLPLSEAAAEFGG